jgi:hypothetical protein
MKKTVIAGLLGALAIGLLAVVVSLVVFDSLAQPALAAQLFGREPKKEDKTRVLTGKVMDNGDNPLPNAVVYLTNTRDHSVKTYIVSGEGTYRFPALQPTIDYEVYAQYNKRRSHTKTVSQFDNRQQVYIDLKIDTKGETQ